ncbi:MAG: transketolase family protein [Candidatus Eisenbacteria bacterium]|nr:transketolase family protein [Candidatus Eisenbacteria bacterium]
MWEMKPTRDAFGEALVELGRANRKVVVVSADLEDSTRAEYFKKQFPERFFNVGIAEQDMLGTCVGLSLDGLIPFACSFAVFLTDRTYGVLRISICYNNRNVKLVGTHAGLTVGEDGATAQSLEDLAVMRVLPNMTVVCPVDAVETKKTTRRIAEVCGPVYMRLGRAPYPILTKESDAFELGRANVMREGKDLTIIACGLMVSESLKAADALSQEGIQARVVNMHTVKPLDEREVVRSAAETGGIVTAEEHQVNGGLGGAVSEVLVRNCPVPQEMVAVRDAFGESGDPEGLLRKYHLKDTDIVAAARAVLKRKKS